MIVTARILLEGVTPIAWRAPAGWEDLPPPPGVALVLDADGRVLGRGRALAGFAPGQVRFSLREPPLPHLASGTACPVTRCVAVRSLHAGWASALVHAEGTDALRGGGRARAQRWQALVRLPEADAPTLAELPQLEGLDFVPE